MRLSYPINKKELRGGSDFCYLNHLTISQFRHYILNIEAELLNLTIIRMRCHAEMFTLSQLFPCDSLNLSQLYS